MTETALGHRQSLKRVEGRFLARLVGPCKLECRISLTNEKRRGRLCSRRDPVAREGSERDERHRPAGQSSQVRHDAKLNRANVAQPRLRSAAPVCQGKHHGVAHRIVDATAGGVFNLSMKRIFAAVLLLTLAVPAWVQDFDKGMQAYDRVDYAAALREWRPLAEKGDAVAQFFLGFMYHQGQGVKRDYAEAVKWYRKAANPDIGNKLRDHAEAVKRYWKVADRDVRNKIKEALDPIGPLADWNLPALTPVFAQFNLGVMYNKGQGVKQDYAAAANWFRKAAKQGLGPAQNILGLMYTNGRGVPNNDAEAAKWYRKAAEQGHASAQFNLGLSYTDGRGVPKDDAEAVRWYRKAAEQENASAQYNLGSMYRRGRGVPQDDAEAVKWYRRAAEQSDADAQFNLGLMYRRGRGVPQDDAEAVEWYRKAAEQGNDMGQFVLGLMYSLGQGVPQDYVAAHKWFSLAASHGTDRATEAQGIVAAKMTPAQIAEAQRLAREWRPKKGPPVSEGAGQ